MNVSAIGTLWNKIFDRINYWMHLTAGIATVFMMLLTIGDIAGRFFWKPISGTYEIVQMVMVPVVFFALAYAQQQGKHIEVTVITQGLSPALKGAFKTFACLLGCALFLIIGYRLFIWAVASAGLQEVTPGAVNLPVYPFKFMAAVACFPLAIRYLEDAILHFSGILRRKNAKENS